MTPKHIGRRTFVKAAGTAVEATVVDAIAEQIVPADEDAGAREAGVVSYIDRQLVGPFEEHQQTYRRGIAGVQQAANAMFGGDFESLSWTQQTRVLRAMERDEAPGDHWASTSARSFFELIRDHTMQGFYGSPRHGGNRNFVSFRMIGLDYPRIVGQNRYTMFPGSS
jgi:gluconate 2-dehydrogenase gamma chain